MGLNDDLQWVGSGDISLPEVADDARFPVTPVRLATAAALSNNTYAAGVLTCASNQSLDAHTIDGRSNWSVGQSLLVKNETKTSNNGVYDVLVVGDSNTPWQLKRAGGWDTSDEVKSGRLVTVNEGTANSASVWQLTTLNPITIGTTALAFSKVADDDAAGTLLSNTADIAAHTTAISNLQSKHYLVTLANTTAADTSAAATSNEVAMTGSVPTGTAILGGTYTLPHGFSNASKADTAITMNVGWDKKNAAIANAIDISEDAAGISTNPVSMLLTPMPVSNGVTALKVTFNSASNLDALSSGLVSVNLLVAAPVSDS